MKKLIAESLKEFRQDREDLNESMSTGGKLYREIFLPVAHALVKANRLDFVGDIVKWGKDLKSKGWPKRSEMKKIYGADVLAKFDRMIKYMEKQQPSMSIGMGAGAGVNKGGDIGKTDEERLKVISDAIDMTPEEIKTMITK